jgi:hypothetical protein
VFRWDPVEDRFIYTGKSYVLEGIRARWDLSKEEITQQIRNRSEILEWMRDNNIRTFKEVAKAISMYTENPDGFMKLMKQSKKKKKTDKKIDEIKSEKTKKDDNKIEKELKNQEVEIIEEDKKIDVFNDIESIDSSTAKSLYEKGIVSIDHLENLSVKELVKNFGIDKKTAKNIVKELKSKKKNTETIDNEKNEEDNEKTSDDAEIIGAFDEIESIDDDTAKLLYNNGYTSVDDLKHVSIKDLKKIKGIKSKTIKLIKKEIDEKFNTRDINSKNSSEGD